jgi:hypothetical protein
MSGAFAFRRLGKELSLAFVKDITDQRAFTLDPESIWHLSD